MIGGGKRVGSLPTLTLTSTLTHIQCSWLDELAECPDVPGQLVPIEAPKIGKQVGIRLGRRRVMGLGVKLGSLTPTRTLTITITLARIHIQRD